ncbi:MAG: TonB-dependent receptor [Beijerinckiaceae bacterium]|nr:MAG: TonB-dependent receptor [Beijerinckiaceae bacterium]
MVSRSFRRLPRLSARAICLSSAFVLTTSARLHAQEAAPDAINLDPVVVSATRLPTPESEIASSITVITSTDMEAKQERTLPDALADVPGLNVVQAGGPGGQTYVYMRGTDPNDTKVLIDGIDASDPSSADGSFDFSSILTSGIERIEVLRGPQSGLYGSDAVGGVINIITKSGSGPAQFHGSAEGGSFGTFNQTAGVSGSASWLSYAFDMAHFHSSDTPVTPFGLVPPGRPVNSDSYDNRTFSLKLGAKIADNFDLGFVSRYLESNLASTSDDYLGPEATPSHSDNQELFTRATAHTVLFNGRFDQTLGLGYTKYNRSFLDPNAAPAIPDFYNGERVKLDWQGNIKLLPGEILTIGAEHQRDQIDNSSPILAGVTNEAGFAQLQSSFGKRVFNTVSVRYDDNSQFGSAVTYRVAPALLIPETGTKLKASLGTGFKAPSLDELYNSYPQYGFFANPALQPEKSLGYDAGFEQGLFKEKLRFGVTYFHNDLRNLIEINDSYTSYVNVGRATTQGIESFIALHPWTRLTLRADYTYTAVYNDITQTELLRRPRHKASISGTWRVTNAAQFSATVIYVGSWLDSNRDGSTTNIPAPAYVLVNLAASYDLGQGVTAFARVNNALNVHYQDPLGFQRPGLGVFGGLRVAFGGPSAAAKTHGE